MRASGIVRWDFTDPGSFHRGSTARTKADGTATVALGTFIGLPGDFVFHATADGSICRVFDAAGSAGPLVVASV